MEDPISDRYKKEAGMCREVSRKSGVGSQESLVGTLQLSGRLEEPGVYYYLNQLATLNDGADKFTANYTITSNAFEKYPELNDG